MSDEHTLARALLSMGYVAGSLSAPAIFMTLVEHLQNGELEPDYVVFLRDTLTRALQLSGVEPMP